MKKRRRKIKRTPIKNFILYPIAFLLASTAIVFAVGRPLISPFIATAAVLTLNSAPEFNVPTVDIFKDKDKSSLMSESERIIVSAKDIPAYGERYGQVICESAGIDAPLFFGDSKKELNQGIGTYSGTYIPGAGRTIIMAGHRDTYFSGLRNVEIGDIIQINTSYGKYQYEVVETKISTDKDTAAYDLRRKDENLIMYTCYPFHFYGMAPKRYFVYANYVSGPKIGAAHGN